MKKFFLFLFLGFILSNSFGQIKNKTPEVDIIDHEVTLGESVRMLSKKYLVDPSEIYKLNKFAVEGISEGMILKIPIPRKEGVANKEGGQIQQKETKTFEKTDVSKKSLPTNEVESQTVEKMEVSKKTVLAKTEQSQSEIATPQTQQTEVPSSNKEIKKIVITERKTEVNHKVLPKETLFSLARDFNVSVEDIKTNNVEVLKNGLQIGQIIVIPKEKSVNIKQTTSLGEEVQKTTAKVDSIIKVPETEKQIQHKVQPKETFYYLSKKYNVSIDEIKAENQEILANGLQIGLILTITPNN